MILIDIILTIIIHPFLLIGYYTHGILIVPIAAGLGVGGFYAVRWLCDWQMRAMDRAIEADRRKRAS